MKVYALLIPGTGIQMDDALLIPGTGIQMDDALLITGTGIQMDGGAEPQSLVSVSIMS